MAEVVYTCCAIVSLTCTVLLARNYVKTQARILVWIAVSFSFFTANNIFVCVDLLLFPEINLYGSVVRNALLALSGLTMAIGLTWEIS